MCIAECAAQGGIWCDLGGDGGLCADVIGACTGRRHQPQTCGAESRAEIAALRSQDRQIHRRRNGAEPVIRLCTAAQRQQRRGPRTCLTQGGKVVGQREGHTFQHRTDQPLTVCRGFQPGKKATRLRVVVRRPLA